MGLKQGAPPCYDALLEPCIGMYLRAHNQGLAAPTKCPLPLSSPSIVLPLVRSKGIAGRGELVVRPDSRARSQGSSAGLA